MHTTIIQSTRDSLPYMRFRDNTQRDILKKAADMGHQRSAPSPQALVSRYQAALSVSAENYDEARRMIAFFFDILGVAISVARPLARDTPIELYRWTKGGQYPPHLEIVPPPDKLLPGQIFDPDRYYQTVQIITGTFPPEYIHWLAPGPEVKTMADLEEFNRVRHAYQGVNGNMYSQANIGLLPDWYTDSVFAQQFFTGTTPTLLTIAQSVWIERFKGAAKVQGKDAIVSMLSSTSTFYVLDYSHFRSDMGAKPDEVFSNTTNGKTKYGCAAVGLFILQDNGKLHPLAIILDYRGSMNTSVTIFNKRLNAEGHVDQYNDWPWRYAKLCVQVSDFAYHEIVVHLNNTHLIEEAIIIAGHRALDPRHVVYRLLKDHWVVTLPLNELARLSLVPNVILPITGYKSEYLLSLLGKAFTNFDWKGLYFPHDLTKRGFPIDKLDDPKFHNYAYARNMLEMWKTIHTFVASVLRNPKYYTTDASVAHDAQVQAFASELTSASGAGLVHFPKSINTLDELIDIVTMCIHIASPQHTAVNYLQEFYQTFPPSKSSALYSPMPNTLEALNRVDEHFLVRSLPVGADQDWLLMVQIPYLLSMPVDASENIVHYAHKISGNEDEVIARAGRQLTADLKKLETVFNRNSLQLDNQNIPYDVMNPEKTAVAIVI